MRFTLIPLNTETKAPNKATKTKTTNSRLTNQDLSATPILNKKTKTNPTKGLNTQGELSPFSNRFLI